MTVVVAGFTGRPELRAAAALILDDLAAQLAAPVVVSTIGTHAIALLPGSGDPINAAIRAATSRLKPGLRTMRVALGVSAAAHSGMLSGALDSARHALQMAELDQTPVSVVSGDEVTSYLRLLATVPDEVRRTFALRVLGAVLDYDKAHDARLRETLETFLALSGSWSQTAAAMHLHVNTVRYRIARVASLTGRDLGRLEDRVDLLLALHSS
jgi:sugar diacid utilization regulator